MANHETYTQIMAEIDRRTRSLIAKDATLDENAAVVECPQIVSTDLNDLICKIRFPSLARGA